MKISVISILLLLSLSLNSQELIADNRKVVEYCDTEMSNFYYGYHCYGYFLGKKNDGEVIINLHVHYEKLYSPYIYIITYKGNIAIPIDSIKLNGFMRCNIKHYDLTKWKLLNSGIISISIIAVNQDNRLIELKMLIDEKMNEQLKEIFNYAKPL